MNILFISPSSHRESVGGIERYIINLIEYCKSQKGLNIKILLPSFGKEYTEQDGNVELIFSSDIAIALDAPNAEVTTKSRSFARKVEEIIAKDKIDIICAENIHLAFRPAYSILLNMVSIIHDIPVVLRLHSFATTDLQRELINQLMWKKISCVSMSVADDCFTSGADVNLLVTQYLGVNTKEFHNSEPSNPKFREQLGLGADDKVVMTATRIINEYRNILAEKGVLNLIESFSKISPHYPDLRLLIAVGKAPESLKSQFKIAMEMLKGYIQLRNIGAQTVIKIFGMDEMPNVYREADLFVLASESETFGQVFVEAMACGTPVIGTKVGGIPEIITDSYNGFLVPPDDASLLAQRIEAVLNNRILREGFVKLGVESVQEKFTLETQFEGFFAMLKELAAKYQQ